MATRDFLIEIQWAQQQTTDNAMHSTPGYAATMKKVLKYAENRALEGQDTEILDSLYFVKEMTGRLEDKNTHQYTTALKIVLRYAEEKAAASVQRSQSGVLTK